MKRSPILFALSFTVLFTYTVVAQDTIHIPDDYPTIQQGINAANNGDIILVSDGLYYENINFKGKVITVASQYLIDGDETHIENTVIDGSQPSHPDSGSVVTFNSGEDTTSILCGFTITGGTGTIIGLLNARIGGGICVFYSSTTIKNNIIELNTITYNDNAYGGGIGANSHDPDYYIIENNIIQNNSINTPVVTTYSLGGGTYTMTDGSVRIINNKIIDNSITAPEAYGGGIEPANFGNANYLIANNIISGNIVNATVGGSGGIDIYNNNPMLKNNLIISNSAPIGGGLWITGLPILMNNTIANNTATTSGGGLEVDVGFIPQIMNCIIWGNTAPIGSQINGTADVSYSDVEGGYPGTENIELNPEFIDTTNFLLNNLSPCIDKGNPDPMYNDIEDPISPGFALWPALGGLRNDMGHCGGPNSFWPYLITSVEEDEADYSQPTNFSLFQNFPNPFNPSTKIKYQIPASLNPSQGGTLVTLKVYDILGSEVATLINEEKSVGTYELTWYAENLPSGVYFYQLRARSFVQTKKMTLIK